MFVDNEVERERRQLISENESNKSRLRACEALLASGTQDRVKFIEGASWICKRIFNVSEVQSEKVQTLLKEYAARMHF